MSMHSLFDNKHIQLILTNHDIIDQTSGADPGGNRHEQAILHHFGSNRSR